MAVVNRHRVELIRQMNKTSYEQNLSSEQRKAEVKLISEQIKDYMFTIETECANFDFEDLPFSEMYSLKDFRDSLKNMKGAIDLFKKRLAFHEQEIKLNH